MTYDRYYYSILSSKEKKVYKIVYNAFEKLQNTIVLKQIDCLGIDLEKIIQYISLDNPHIFYVDTTCFRWTDSILSKSISINYLYTTQEVKHLQNKINHTLSLMLQKVNAKTEYEKVKAVHNLLTQNIDYDNEALKNYKKYASRSNSILGVLFYKTAVCEGVAKVFKLILNLLNIKCLVATGKSLRDGVLHAWNIVKINNESYHVDVTWDIDENKKFIKYDYLNLHDAEIKKDHGFDSGIYPICNNNTYNYFHYNKLVANTKADVHQIVERAICKNEKHITFRYNNTVNITEALKELQFNLLLRTMLYCVNAEQQICTILI